MSLPKERVHYSLLDFNAVEEARKLRDRLPQLWAQRFDVTSGSTRGYNCLAYSVGDDTQWWEPIPAPDEISQELGGYHWPHDPEIPALFSVPTIEKIFRKLGYEPCHDPFHVAGAEKIAIYGDGSINATHVARQRTSDGIWLSKMGPFGDIEHGLPEAIQGGSIGKIQRFMVRHQKQIAAGKPVKLLLPGGVSV